jgi:HAD superfamily hydrolase (TIGR01509 family)
MKTPNHGLRAVLFDMDGTLVDSEPIHHRALADVMAAEGIVLPAGFDEACTGMTIDGVHARILAHGPHLRLGVQALAQAKDAAFLQRQNELVWRPGAQEAVAAVRGASVRMAVVSNSDRMLVDASLRALGLQQSGQISVCRNDVRQGKPDPEPYLRAAWLLGLSPDACLVVEDSPTGARAGLAAGMTVLAWPEPSRSDLQFPEGCPHADPADLRASLMPWL